MKAQIISLVTLAFLISGCKQDIVSTKNIDSQVLAYLPGTWAPEHGDYKLGFSSNIGGNLDPDYNYNSTYGPVAVRAPQNMSIFWYDRDRSDYIMEGKTSYPHYYQNINWFRYQTPAKSKAEPAAVMFNGQMYLFWKGCTNDYIYYSYRTPCSTNQNPWAPITQLPTTAYTQIAFAAVVSKDMGPKYPGEYLHLFYKGKTNNHIYHICMNSNKVWSNLTQLTATTDSRPAAVWDENNKRIIVSYKCHDSNELMVLTTTDPSTSIKIKDLAFPGDGRANAWQGPSLCFDGDILWYAVARTDGQIRFGSIIEFNDQAWDFSGSFIPAASTKRSCPFLFIYNPNTLYVLHQGRTNNYIYYSGYTY